ncbi:beta-galactosidase [Alteromonadaceae bacterium M269]|nr:beta-galactosidase [Alteromonadaceae bacterium M269]
MSRHLQLGVCDYPEHTPESNWQSHAEQQKALGLSVVRIAEFSWAKIEPQEGEYHWEWLDKAITVYANQGLSVVLGTPTATPPAWLIEKHPEILPVDQNGIVKQFGSRRHYDHASDIYKEYATLIVIKMLERYAQNKAVVGWQTDNELAHEGTGQSFGGASAEKFPDWLKKKYGAIEALNEAWGTIFWSQTYNDWHQIKPPTQVATGQANPSHLLDYRRFCSDMVAQFQDSQIQLIRQHAPHHFITHNFVILSEETDLYRLAEDLDFVAWDSYPIGMLEFFATWESEETKTAYARTGHPDLISLNHDIYRGLKNGEDFWVMEQQCGHANWAQYNPLPADNAVSLWTAQAWAHGASAVVYFRWRAAHMAQEIMHSGLLRQDGTQDRGYSDVASLEPSTFSLDSSMSSGCEVVLLHDYQSLWAYNHQPHHQDLNYWRQFTMFYSALRALGIDVDISSSKNVDLSQYKLVVAPALTIFDDSVHELIRNTDPDTQWIFGPRCGFKDATGKVPQKGQFQGVQDILGVRQLNFDSLRPGLTQDVTISEGGLNKVFEAQVWCESYELEEGQTEYVYSGGPQDGKTAVARNNNMTMIGALSKPLTTEIMTSRLTELGVETEILPEGVRLSQRSGSKLVFNFNQQEIQWKGKLLSPVSYQFLS